VTVVTPFYNLLDVFDQTAKCVLGQSLQEWEWLIVNDGSTLADSLQVIEKYRFIDPRVHVLDHPENRGLSAARNKGYREAKAQFVFQLDGDDLIEPTTLEKCLWYLLGHPRCSFVKGFTVGFGSIEYLWTHGFHDGARMLTENMVTATAMVRRSVHEDVGGYRESLLDGLEDWDFWLRCAAKGYWGATIPEYFDWYRRRDRHWEAWSNVNDKERLQQFVRSFREEFPRLWNARFPAQEASEPTRSEDVLTAPPAHNLLDKSNSSKRLLIIVPRLSLGGTDTFNLQLVGSLVTRGWEVTIATTSGGDHSWMADFTSHTPDVFAMHHFLRLADYPAFLRYLIESRRPDVVLLSNSEMAYLLLPFLRATCPNPIYIDYCQEEVGRFKSVGCPPYAITSHGQLDLKIVSSKHLKDWMITRGVDPNQIEVCYAGGDTHRWRRDARVRAETRAQFDLTEDCPVILYAGRLVPQKRPHLFVNVIRKLADRGLRFQALVAGEGPALPGLESVEQHGRRGSSGHVRFLGAIPASGMPKVLAACDILFLPGASEGISMMVLEAMSAECVVVCANVGGQTELVTAECGVLISQSTEAEEEAAYFNALTKLIQDGNLRSKIGRLARERIREHFSLSDTVARMESLFFNVGRTRQRTSLPSMDDATARDVAWRALEHMQVGALAESIAQERDSRHQKTKEVRFDHTATFGGSPKSDLVDEARRRSSHETLFNVLYCIPYCPVGGAERVDLDILSGLPTDQFRVTLVTVLENDHAWLHKFEQLVSEVFSLPDFSADHDQSMALLLYLCRSRNVDLIFNRNTSIGYELIRAIKRFTTTVAGADLLHLYEGPGDWVEASASYDSDLDARFVISEDLRKHIAARCGLDADRFTLVYNGIDITRELSIGDSGLASARIRQEFGIPEGAPIVSFVGRLAPQKDPVRWVSLAASIARRSSAHFLIVGEGELHSQVREMIRVWNLSDRVHMAGYRDDVDSIYAATSVLMMTSKYEGLPLVVQESMLQGTPVVATCVGATGEAIDDTVGVALAANASNDEIVQAVLRVLEARESDTSLGTRCKERVRSQFGLDQMQYAYMKEFNRLCAKRNIDQRNKDYEASGVTDKIRVGSASSHQFT